MKTPNTIGSTGSALNKRYMPGLDGLRAISVLAVIAYHLDLAWAPGGLLGVSIFFTLSGYLITDQLLSQWEIDIKDFWIRRIKRLIPGLLFMLGIVMLYLVIFNNAMLGKLQGDFISALFYVNNWWLIFHNVSYFQSFGPPSPIGHLWSLAIEEQFYLFWPLILIVITRYTARRSKLITFTLLGAAASVVAMAVLYNVGEDPSRVYYGTDTRVFAILIGAALAMVWPSWNLPEQVSEQFRKSMDRIGAFGLLLIIFIIWKTSEYDPALYLGGLALFSVLAAVVTGVLVHPASHLGRIMGCKPLRWIGVRSYSLYLWHYPVIALTSPAVDTGGLNMGRLLLQLAITFGLAALSWKFVEEPLRRGSFRGWLESLRSIKLGSIRYAAALMTLFLVLFAFGGPRDFSEEQIYASAPGSVDQTGVNPVPSDDNKSGIQVDPDQFDVVIPAKNISDTPAKPLPDAGTSQKPLQDPNVKPPEKPESQVSPVKSKLMITAIGDSVILGAAAELQKIYPNMVIDGKLGRQANKGTEVAQRLKAQGKLGQYVIIELGSNGPIKVEQYKDMLLSLGDVKQIIIINTRVPRKWESAVNKDLANIAKGLPNATLIDWYGASSGHNEYFWNDGIHLRPVGGKAYAQLISDALKKGPGNTAD